MNNILLVLFAMIACSSSGLSEDAEVGVLINKIVTSYPKAKETEFIAETDIARLTACAKSGGDDLFSSAALAALWKKGQRTSVSLTWWESNDRQTRITCLALILLQPRDPIVTEGVEQQYAGYIERFNAIERMQRREEFDAVMRAGGKLEKVLHGKQ